MDTEWFAVDADGHVAIFDTGEGGAMPEAGNGYYQEAYGLLEELRDAVPAGEVIYDPARLPAGREHVPSDFVAGRALLVFLDSLDPIAKEIESGDAEVVQSTKGVAAVFRRITSRVRSRLHYGSDACKGCISLADDEDDRPDPAKLGLYVYSCDDGFPTPYQLDRRPMTPIKLEQLPPELRRHAGEVRYKFCFADEPVVQPAEHGAVATWGTHVFLSSDGKTLRRMPDASEANARAEADELGDDFEYDPTPWESRDRPVARARVEEKPAAAPAAPAVGKAAAKKRETKSAAKKPTRKPVKKATKKSATSMKKGSKRKR
jgi:hypothetical protein